MPAARLLILLSLVGCSSVGAGADPDGLGSTGPGPQPPVQQPIATVPANIGALKEALPAPTPLMSPASPVAQLATTQEVGGLTDATTGMPGVDGAELTALAFMREYLDTPEDVDQLLERYASDGLPRLTREYLVADVARQKGLRSGRTLDLSESVFWRSSLSETSDTVVVEIVGLLRYPGAQTFFWQQEQVMVSKSRGGQWAVSAYAIGRNGQAGEDMLSLEDRAYLLDGQGWIEIPPQ